MNKTLAILIYEKMDKKGLLEYNTNLEQIQNLVDELFLENNLENNTIYKIRYIINKNTPRSTKHNWERIEDQEIIIIGNLETALNKFNELSNKCEEYKFCNQHFGFCELFIPKIHDDGSIAYFPENEKYIVQVKFNNTSNHRYDQ